MKRASIASWRAVTLLGLALCAPSMAAVTPSSGGAGHVPEFTLAQIVGTHNIGQFVLSPDRHGGRVHARRTLLRPSAASRRSAKTTTCSCCARQRRAREADDAAPPPRAYPAFSPDGRFVAYESEGDIWTVEIATGAAQRLTTDWATDRSAAWSPDGSEIALRRAAGAARHSMSMNARGEREGLAA